MITAMNVAGARPNYMKVAPLHRAMAASGTVRLSLWDGHTAERILAALAARLG